MNAEFNTAMPAMKWTKLLVFFLLSGSPVLLIAQLPPQPREYWELPTACVSAHDVGKLVLGVSNKGYFGNTTQSKYYDCINGNTYYSGSEYPRNSLINYLWHGSIWIGGVRRGDTLVSEGFFGFFFEPSSSHLHPPYSEFNPEDAPLAEIKQISSIKGSKYYDKSAVSHQDLRVNYTDTIVLNDNIYFDNHPGTTDFLDSRLHKPLFIEITENSYAWSHEYAEDFVLFELSVKNIGEKTIDGFSLGINLEHFAGYKNISRFSSTDDLVGFMKSYSRNAQCGFVDTLNLVWVADNDGDPFNGEFSKQLVTDTSGEEYKSATDAIGAIFVSVPDDPPIYFNWWTYNTSDFGPMMRGNYRNFRTGGLGDPQGDRNKFFIMGNGEIDYDPAYAKKIDQFNQTWLYPDQQWLQQHLTGGQDYSALISFQDGFLTPGGSMPIVFAVVMGENFHTDPGNLQNLPDRPDRYYDNLDFSDLAKNAQWAKWIYDNPGIDTDGDGYKGEYRVCVLDSVLDVDSSWIATVAETTYYKGDGVPDWKAALPPPTPKMWVTPMFRGINIRFNGQESENSKDIFTQMNDFEGYHVYISRDDREQSYSLLASYDIENYDKYIWNEGKQPDAGWELLDFPMSMRDIRCKYAYNCNDSSFDPLRFRPSQPYQLRNFPESLFYWEKHQWNVSEFGVTSDIKKRFPSARDPRGIPADSLTPNDYTDDGYLKYFEYEYIVDNILPTVQYYVSVSAFDFGWPKSRLEPLETSITENAQAVFASVIDSAFGGNNKQVVVYPNPYRLDEEYRSRGLEGLGQEERSNERVRRIHFANLPPKCKIMIFSLDGDLVREIHHDKSPSDPTASHEEWGLISKNGLAVVSGLYYWVVESDDGTVQMGKLAIIL